MQLNARAPALALVMLSFLTACATPGRAVFDGRAVPAPPGYSADFKRALGAELEAAGAPPLTVQALGDASQFYDQIRRLKAGESGPR